MESKTIASHLNIKHQTALCIRIIVFKKFFRRGEGSDSEPMRTQQTRERVANRRVVVYKKYSGAWGNSHQWLSAIFLHLTPCRKAEMKRRAALSIVPNADVPSMRVNDGAADGKPKPHSVGFCCKERLEDSFFFFLWNAVTPVGNGWGAAGVGGSATVASGG